MIEPYTPPEVLKCRHKYHPLAWPRNALTIVTASEWGHLGVEAKCCARCGLIRYRFWRLNVDGGKPWPFSGWGYAESLEELILGEVPPPMKAGALVMN